MFLYTVSCNKGSLFYIKDNLGYFEFFFSVLLTGTPYVLNYDELVTSVSMRRSFLFKY
jgi:hypothetical protein